MYKLNLNNSNYFNITNLEIDLTRYNSIKYLKKN